MHAVGKNLLLTIFPGHSIWLKAQISQQTSVGSADGAGEVGIATTTDAKTAANERAEKRILSIVAMGSECMSIVLIWPEVNSKLSDCYPLLIPQTRGFYRKCKNIMAIQFALSTLQQFVSSH